MRAALVALALSACAHAPAPSAASCPASFESLPSGTCLTVPANASASTPVLLFLHGMYPDATPQQEFALEAALGAAATKRGFAVLAPRGRKGLCDWSPQWADWRCWPNRDAQKPLVGEFLRAWGEDFVSTAKRLHRDAPIRPYVLGFSNGGFFTSLLASDTNLLVSGFAIAHGGIVEPGLFDLQHAAPTLLLAAEEDQWQRPLMERLHQRLDGLGWKHDFVTRPGGHALSESDIDAALQFFEAHAR